MDRTPEELRLERAADVRGRAADVADTLAVATSDRAQALAGEASDRAIALAEKRGREQAIVDARLQDHDRHLQAINGSVERLATSQESLEQHFLRIDRAREREKARHEDQEDRKKDERHEVFSKRQKRAGIIMLAMVALGSLSTLGYTIQAAFG